MVDRAASERARAEGNAAFRQGKWALSIAHYTRAAALDPTDGVPLTNRAQARLKLEQYEDAERDCDAALRLGPAVKASYRRALARRARGDVAGALADIDDVLVHEPANGAALSERAELLALTSSRPAPAPAPQAAAVPSSSGPRQAIDHALPATAPAQAVTGFAALRQAREGKKAFAGRPTANAAHAAAASPSTATLAIPQAAAAVDSAVAASTSIAASSLPAAPVPAPVSSSPPPPARLPPLPSDPNSTAPGAGLVLLRLLTPDPATNFRVLRHYDPAVIARILDPLLEPDTLGSILLALASGVGAGTGTGADTVMGAGAGGGSGGEAGAETALDREEERAFTRHTISELRTTKRWRINVAMLSRAEREAGERAWATGGGEGRFA